MAGKVVQECMPGSCCALEVVLGRCHGRSAAGCAASISKEYEAAFFKNHIDEAVLPNLTAEDLRDLGVGSIGHRRKLLDAIALLRGDAEAKHRRLKLLRSLSPLKTSPSADRSRSGSRDLVGSTRFPRTGGPRGPSRECPPSLSEACRRDRPALWGPVCSEAAWAMGCSSISAIRRPHEDDAEQAVRAGLALIEAVGALKSAVSLQTRVGIATRLVLLSVT